MKQVLSEQELLERLGALPREITPERDVWPAIAQRMERQDTPCPQQPSSRWWKQAVAASVAVVLVAGVLIGRQLGPTPEVAQSGADPANRAQAVWVGGLTGALTASEIQYRAAFREFISVGESRDNLPQQTVDNLLASWADLSAAETALTNALRDNPGNPFLSAKLLELRSWQLDFLRQIAALDHHSRRTTI